MGFMDSIMDSIEENQVERPNSNNSQGLKD